MDLAERMLEHDPWLTRKLTVRSMLERLVFTKEMWTSAIEGRALPEGGGSSLACLRERLDRYGPEFESLVRRIRDRGEWDTAFVDATCDPPETFTYGGAVAHVLTWSAHRRQVLIGALRERGVEVTEADPLAWERSR